MEIWNGFFVPNFDVYPPVLIYPSYEKISSGKLAIDPPFYILIDGGLRETWTNTEKVCIYCNIYVI